MPDQQRPRLGQQVGEYRLVRELGSGGFGTVYLAKHRQKHTQVAVKVLDIPRTSGEDFKDLLNEARIIGLRHPHIVSLLDFGISRHGHPFLVMEYAPEGTLRDRHPKGERVALPTIVSYVDQLGSALQYAHNQRVIHRDVKPENILVRADGTLLVSDFGIAKFLEQSVLMSQQTQVGTPVYMAPEQHLGYPCFASDQYALSVVIYEWICGVRPFQGTALGLITQHLTTSPPRLRDHLPELSEVVEHVVLKALAKAPGDRFESIQEMASALREAVQSPPSVLILNQSIEASNTAALTPAEEVSRPVASPKPEALRRTLTDTAGVPLEPAMRATGVPSPLEHSVSTFPLASEGPPSNSVSPTPHKRLPGKRSSLLIAGAPGLVLLLVVSVITLRAIIPLQRGRLPMATSVERGSLPTATSVEEGSLSTDTVTGSTRWSTLTVVDGVVYVGPAHNQVYAIDASTGQREWTFPARNATSHTMGNNGVQPSPAVVDGVVYFGSGDKKVYAIDARTGQQKWAFSVGDEVDSSPTVQSGVLYIGCIDRNVYAIDTSTGQKKWIFPTGGEVHLSPTVVNGVVYVYSDDSSVYAIDAQIGGKKWVFPTSYSGSSGLNVVPSPPMVANGVVYVSSPGDKKVYAIDARTGEKKWSFFMGGSRLISPPIVQSGVLYVGSIDGNVYAVDAGTGEKKWAFPAGGRVYAVLTVADGTVYVISINGTVYAIDTTTGQQRWAFPTKNATGSWVQPPPIVVDGVVYVASDDSNVYAIDTATGQMRWATPADSHGWSLPVVINGMLYTTGSYDGTVYAIDTATGQQKWILAT